MTAGRWKAPEMVARYIAHERAGRGQVLRRVMGSAGFKQSLRTGDGSRRRVPGGSHFRTLPGGSGGSADPEYRDAALATRRGPTVLHGDPLGILNISGLTTPHAVSGH